MWNIKDLLKPPVTYPASGIGDEGLQALFFDNVPFKGTPTQVFAWYGIPPEVALGPVPGIVLVHGGLGTAYADWVKLWNSRGYAALAFDHGGHLPVKENGGWKMNPDGGPLMDDGKQVREAEADQWMYHAVAATLRAHALLRSFPEVDPKRTGITGISWGGVVALIAAALDDRFKFVVPVYGCGYISSHSDTGDCFVGKNFALEDRARWNRLWDPQHYLNLLRSPTLWVNGTNDFAFTPGAWRRSHRAAPGTRHLLLKVGMPHGHGGPGESPEEIRGFADSVVQGGVPLIEILGQGSGEGRAWVEYCSAMPLRAAELCFTCDQGLWQNRKWHETRVDFSLGLVSAGIPAGAVAWYFNLIDRHGLVVSSEHEDVTCKTDTGGEI